MGIETGTLVKFTGETAKVMTFLRQRWGLSNHQIVEKIVTEYAEEKGLYEKVKVQV